MTLPIGSVTSVSAVSTELVGVGVRVAVVVVVVVGVIPVATKVAAAVVFPEPLT